MDTDAVITGNHNSGCLIGEEHIGCEGHNRFHRMSADVPIVLAGMPRPTAEPLVLQPPYLRL
jgi:hypothetical protein